MEICRVMIMRLVSCAARFGRNWKGYLFSLAADFRMND